ncbi:MAG: hypothetical protein EBR30_01565 [Cytophagia bacterium]|nr:hypothetical protein [Cytophagia bacterium]
MSRKALFTDVQVQEMKESIRTGEPIAMLAEKLATKYNVPTNTLRNKLYSVAKRTRKIAEWNGPKRRRQKNTEMSSVTTTNVPTSMGKKVEMYADHIRIYF